MINDILSTECSEIYKRCKNYDVISIDIFDTALVRLVNKPEEIFATVGEMSKLQDFKSLRINTQIDIENKNEGFPISIMEPIRH